MAASLYKPDEGTDSGNRIESAHPKCTSSTLRMIQAGADLNAKDDKGLTPLHKAIKHSNICNIMTLIKKGADLEYRLSNGDTFLMYAISNGYLQSALALLKIDEIDVNLKNVRGVTALHLAAKNWHVDITNSILMRGGCVDAKDNRGRKPLHYAAGARECSLFGPLLTQWSDCRTDESSEKDTETVSLDTASDTPGGRTALLLLDNGADVNSEDEMSMTPLHCAAAAGLLHVARVLIDKGADPSIMHKSGENDPIHLATMFGKYYMLPLLRTFALQNQM